MIPRKINDWDLASSNLRRVRENTYELAVLPTSAIEPHNLHLPYGQDWYQITAIGRRACELAAEKSKKVLLLPGIPYGVDANLMDFPYAMHVSQRTLDAIITDLVTSLKHFGLRKTVILNGHGGNCFIPLVRELQAELDIHLFVCDFFKFAPDAMKEIFDNQGDHADEHETSIAMALFDDLVEFEHAKDGAAPPFKFDALNQGWAKTSRRFARLNDHCGTGDPRKATAQKGKAFLDVVCQRLANFFIDLAETPLDEKFPHA